MNTNAWHSSLEWSVLEIDEDEWAQRTDGVGPASAGDTPSTHTSVPQTHGNGLHNSPPSNPMERYGYLGQRLKLIAAVLLLTLVIYKIWHSAQLGVAKMQQDVANVVKLDAAKARAAQQQLAEQAAVEAVEFFDGLAVAQVVITRTWSSGQVFVQHQTQFFEQTAQGWRRTEPAAAFWGQPQVMDTPNLHFVFRRLDRAAAEQLAPGAEALYVALRRATGQSLAPDGGRLTIEIVPEQVPAHANFVNGSVRLPSPYLFDLAFGYTSEELLASLLRKTLADQMLDRQLHATALKPQWQPIVVALGMWLTDSDALPLAAPHIHTAYQTLVGSSHVSGLRQLLGCGPCTDSTAKQTSNVYYPGAVAAEERQAASAINLIDFVVATYGIDVLPELLQGFGHHEDWETLIPAVLDTNAAELEAAWHGSAQTSP